MYSVCITALFAFSIMSAYREILNKCANSIQMYLNGNCSDMTNKSQNERILAE